MLAFACAAPCQRWFRTTDIIELTKSFLTLFNFAQRPRNSIVNLTSSFVAVRETPDADMTLNPCVDSEIGRAQKAAIGRNKGCVWTCGITLTKTVCPRTSSSCPSVAGAAARCLPALGMRIERGRAFRDQIYRGTRRRIRPSTLRFQCDGGSPAARS
jgi:hypothetical protein